MLADIYRRYGALSQHEIKTALKAVQNYLNTVHLPRKTMPTNEELESVFGNVVSSMRGDAINGPVQH